MDKQAVRPVSQVIEDILASKPHEVSAADGYRLVLQLLREQMSHYGEAIWNTELDPDRTRILRGRRAQLKQDIAIIEALAQRMAAAS